MGLKKGNTNNPAGRPAGRPNLLTREMRLILKNIIANELEKIPDTLEKMELEKRLDVVLKLLPYVLPKVDNVNMTNDEPIEYNFSIGRG